MTETCHHDTASIGAVVSAVALIQAKLNGNHERAALILHGDDDPAAIADAAAAIAAGLARTISPHSPAVVLDALGGILDHGHEHQPQQPGT